MRHLLLHKYILPFLGRGLGVGSFLLLCSLMTSCEFFDIDEEGMGIATEMTLDHDTIYVMQGDTFSIKPTFTPDDLEVADLFFLPVHDDVVAVRGDYLEAVGTGATQICYGSISASIIDTCMVYVMAPWTQRWRTWPYETVFYAHVTVGGQPLTEDMELAAFVGDECRATGVQKSAYDISFWQLRVGTDKLYNEDDWGDDGEDDEYDAENVGNNYLPHINFRCYDHRHHRLYTTSVNCTFDGETHGTLSNLFEIAF